MALAGEGDGQAEAPAPLDPAFAPATANKWQRLVEAAVGFEPTIRDLQSLALVHLAMPPLAILD